MWCFGHKECCTRWKLLWQMTCSAKTFSFVTVLMTQRHLYLDRVSQPVNVFSLYSVQSNTNQINSWFSAPPTTRTTTHYIVHISSITRASYSSQPWRRMFSSSAWKLAHTHTCEELKDNRKTKTKPWSSPECVKTEHWWPCLSVSSPLWTIISLSLSVSVSVCVSILAASV